MLVSITTGRQKSWSGTCAWAAYLARLAALDKAILLTRSVLVEMVGQALSRVGRTAKAGIHSECRG